VSGGTSVSGVTEAGRREQPPSPAPPAGPENPLLPRARRPIPWLLLLTVALGVTTNVLLLTHTRVSVVGAALGWWLIVVYPTYLISTTRVWERVTGAERVLYSLGAVLLVLVVGGLVLDVGLPPLGVARPLTLVPVLVMVDCVAVALMCWRRSRGAITGWLAPAARSVRTPELWVLVVSALCVPLVVAGANRLNNGAGDTLSLIGLAGVVVAFAILVFWRAAIRDTVVSIAAYLLGLSLLLSTSLRGWYVTGHDIQHEYTVFQLTKDQGVWKVGGFHDAYYACLSITILPTEIWQLVRVDDPYIFKVFFQLLFATCPVMVYLLARRYCSKLVAILGVVYFVSFPTFFTDMPFLNRQEIAFVFLGLAYLALTRRQWSAWRRRLIVIAFGLGMGLCHYSTIYVFIGTLGIAWLLERIAALLERLRRGDRGPQHNTRAGWSDRTRIVTPVVIVSLALVAYLWGGPITQSAGGVKTTVEEALPQVFGGSGGGYSADTSYGLFLGSGPSPQQLLNQYRAQTLSQRTSFMRGTYLPLSEVDAAKTTLIATPNLPLTRLGSFLSQAHVPVTALNDAVRGLAAKGEQVFLVVGLAAWGFSRWRRRQFGRDFFMLSLASVIMVGAITVLPGLSVSYGLLRAFQQALFLVAPVLVSGSIFLLQPLGRVWAPRAAAVVALVILFSTIGLMPQLLGGYPAQLNLNNSGDYYDAYYVHDQEIAALDWLGQQPGTLPAGVQANVQADITSDRWTFKNPGDISASQVVTDFYPTLLRKSTWVVLGYSTVRSGVSYFVGNGNLIPYKYPVGVLKASKDLVYDNGSTWIYK
jgi:uncharacterized membrane protein